MEANHATVEHYTITWVKTLLITLSESTFRWTNSTSVTMTIITYQQSISYK